MRKITIAAALLTVIGSAAALAQGAPPGSSSWKASALHSRSSSSVATVQAHGTGEAKATVVAKKDGAIPVA